MNISIVKDDLRFADNRLDEMADFFRVAKIREQTGATFYQYLLCPEYYESKVIEMKGGDCAVVH